MLFWCILYWCRVLSLLFGTWLRMFYLLLRLFLISLLRIYCSLNRLFCCFMLIGFLLILFLMFMIIINIGLFGTSVLRLFLNVRLHSNWLLFGALLLMLLVVLACLHIINQIIFVMIGSADSSREMQLCEYLSTMNNANEVLNIKLKQLRFQVESLSRQNITLKSELRKLESLHEKKLAEMEVLITDLQASNSELSYNLNVKIQENLKLAERLQIQSTQYRTSDDYLFGLRRQMGELNDSLVKIRDQHPESELFASQLLHLRKENDTLQLNMLGLMENNRLIALADRHIWESRLELIQQNYENRLDEYKHTIQEINFQKQHMEVVLNARIRQLESEPLLLRPSQQILDLSEVSSRNDQTQEEFIQELKRQNSLLRRQLSQVTDKFSQQLEKLCNYYEQLSKSRPLKTKIPVSFDSIWEDCRNQGRLYQQKILQLLEKIRNVMKSQEKSQRKKAELAQVQLELYKRL